MNYSAILLIGFSTIMLTGCCALKNPLDGKAQSWCESEKMAMEYCHAEHKTEEGKKWITFTPSVSVECYGNQPR